MIRPGFTLLTITALTALSLAGAGAAHAPLNSLPRAAAPAAPAAAAFTDATAIADRYVAENRVPGIVMALGVEAGAPVFVARGRIAAEADARAADPDSLFRVYSMTKPITAMAAMILVGEGKLRLDQPIADFIPGFRTMRVLTNPAANLESRPATRQITVRHLLTHTAGLGYSIITTGPLKDEYERQGINPGQINLQFEQAARGVRPTSLAAFADRVATLPLIADPGTRWSYSISLDVLARVVEVAGGMPFERFVQTRIFDPLQMRSSYWSVPASEVGRLTTNYFWAGANRVVLDPGNASVFAQPPSFPYGGAELVMSTRDYDRFLHMLMNEGELDGARIMSAETARLAMSNLLPDGVTYPGAPSGTGGSPVPQGYGAGGSVYLAGVPGGPGRGTFGWGGAAGTIAWVDRENGVRETVMVQI